MKTKIISTILILTLALSLCGCQIGRFGSKKLKVGMLTDTGGLYDKGYNQIIYDTIKKWCEENNSEVKYYVPIENSEEDRLKCMDKAAEDKCEIVFMASYSYSGVITKQSIKYPDIKIVGIDISANDILENAVGDKYDGNPSNWNVKDYYNAKNTYCCIYKEEYSGYMAGYSAVKLGYRHLGFLGGIPVPAVVRFGYGYLQGIDKAASELGIDKNDQITVEYAYGNQFFSSDDITKVMKSWYNEKNVEVIFACGGGIYKSVADAAVGGNGKMIGVDIDQQGIITNEYKGGMVVTSATKGLDVTVKTVLNEYKNDNFDKLAGKIDNLGMNSKKPTKNYVQLPYSTTKWSNEYTKKDYKNLVEKLVDKVYKVSDDVNVMPVLNIKVNNYGNLK